jgi:hypothetical protein
MNNWDELNEVVEIGNKLRKVREYLEEEVKLELKWMYHYDTSSEVFGVQTDKYQWCRQVLNGDVSVEAMVDYFEKNYGKDEQRFTSAVRELAGLRDCAFCGQPTRDRLCPKCNHKAKLK